MFSHIAALLSVLGCVSAEYFGVKLGDLSNSSYGLSGQVYLVNRTAIQIRDFSLNAPNDKLDLGFFFSTASDATRGERVFEIIASPNGLYSKPISSNLDSGFKSQNLVVTIPESNEKWTFFGVVSEAKWLYLSAVRIAGKTAPAPYCCIRDPRSPNKGLVAAWYNVGADPIEVLDAKTLKVPKFTFEGQKPPDGWFLAGSGTVDQKGKKALVVGRDTADHHCPLKENYTGDKDFIVELADGQTVYDISYFSVYCYAVGVDFGHVPVNIDQNKVSVPPYIPPVRDSPPPAKSDGRNC